MDAHPKVVNLAEALPPSAWQRLERLPNYEILRASRESLPRSKNSIVLEKEFKNQVLVGEDIAEIDYQPLSARGSIGW